MFEVGGIRNERGSDIRERRHDEARLHVEPLEVAGEAAQAIDDGIGLEGAVLLGKRHEAARVEHDTELGLQGRRERRVEEGRAAQAQLEVGAVTADREGAKKDRRPVVDAVELPLCDADSEVHGVDAAHRREFEGLRGDRACGMLRRTQREIVADEAREQRRLAGDELGEASGVRRAELDTRRRAVDEVEKRIRAAGPGELCPPSVPCRLGHVHGREAGVPEAERMRRRDLRLGACGVGRELHWVAQEVVVMIAGPPHDATLSGNMRFSGEARPVSRGRLGPARRGRPRAGARAKGQPQPDRPARSSPPDACG